MATSTRIHSYSEDGRAFDRARVAHGEDSRPARGHRRGPAARSARAVDCRGSTRPTSAGDSESRLKAVQLLQRWMADRPEVAERP